MKKANLVRIGAIGALVAAIGTAQLALTTGTPGGNAGGSATGRAQAAPIVHVSTAELEGESERIFSGTVTDIRPRLLASGAAVNTDVEIHVTNRIKGDPAQSETVEVLGGKLGEVQTMVTSQPVFYVGEEVFIFGRTNPALAGLEVVAGQYGKLQVDNGSVTGADRDQSLRSLVDEVVAEAARQGRTLDVPALDETKTSASMSTAPKFTTFPYRWSGGTLSWVFNPSQPNGSTGIPAASTVEGIMVSGFQQWQNAAGLHITYNGQSTSPVVDVVCIFQGSCPPTASGDGTDHINTLGWVLGLQAGELGRTVCIRTSSGAALDCDIGFNANITSIGATWATGSGVGANQYDLVTTVLHEEGHLLGLGHSWNTQPDCQGCAQFPPQPSASDRAAVMYYIINSSESKRTLTCDDIVGIRAAYNGAPDCTVTAPAPTATPAPKVPGCPAPGSGAGTLRRSVYLPFLAGGTCK